MIQADSFHPAWLEDKGRELVLMIYVDDATNNTYAQFYDYEGIFPAMDSFKNISKNTAFLKVFTSTNIQLIDRPRSKL